MSRRGIIALLTLAVTLACGLSGCAAPIVTIADPPQQTSRAGTFSAGHGKAPLTGSQAAVQLGAAEVPALCGLPPAVLADGALSATPAASPADPGAELPASHISIARDEADEPIAVLGGSPRAAIAGAAAFECLFDGGARARDRVVVWDAGLRPLGAIDVSSVRGEGPAAIVAIELVGDGARVSFRPALPDGSAHAVAPVSIVTITAQDGQLLVGRVTVG